MNGVVDSVLAVHHALVALSAKPRPIFRLEYVEAVRTPEPNVGDWFLAHFDALEVWASVAAESQVVVVVDMDLRLALLKVEEEVVVAHALSLPKADRSNSSPIPHRIGTW